MYIDNFNKAAPCCRYQGPALHMNMLPDFNGDLNETLNSDHYELLRHYSETGQKLPCCQKCYDQEEMGEISLRQKLNAKHNDIKKVELKSIDIALDNICNLTCDGCNENYSSEWSKKLYPDEPSSFHITSTKDIFEIPESLREIVFMGGEPLMTNRHYNILKKVKNKNEMDLMYQTNGTHLLNDKTIEILKEFKSVFMNVSIDGYGELNDKVRSGSKFSDVEKFIEQCKDLGFIRIGVHTTVHMNNWRGLDRLSQWICENRLEEVWTVDILRSPEALNIVNVEDKEKYSDYVNSIKFLPSRQYLLEHIKGRL